jgi:FkbM family methyltransferase
MYSTSNDGHSYLPKLLKPGGWALDVGCRDFGFSKLMVENGLKVIAIDPDPDVGGEAVEPNITILHFALIGDRLSGAPNQVPLFLTDASGYTNNIFRGDPKSALLVSTKTLPELTQEIGIGFFEIVKLDCEGAEYSILENWPGPIARQISVEFHDFLGMNPEPDAETYYRRMFAHLEQWYAVSKHRKEVPDWGGAPIYADSVFVLKEAHEAFVEDPRQRKAT